MKKHLNINRYLKTGFIFISISILLAACGGNQPAAPAAKNGLNVIATTTLVGDVVQQIGGEKINLTILLPVGTDPHSYQPTPQDLARISSADVIFANGAGLETFLEGMLENADSTQKAVYVSAGIELREFEGEVHADEEEQAGEEEHDGDPHVWTDPQNVQVWVQNITKKLAELDSANSSFYNENAARYSTELDNLDAWIKEQVAQLPEANRNIVTDHMALGYFADRYGFRQVGAVIPGYSTLSEPTAKDLAALEDAIRSLGVKAVFVESTVNPAISQRVAEDTGIQIFQVYSGSLSGPEGPAASYLDLMRYNTETILNALK